MITKKAVLSNRERLFRINKLAATYSSTCFAVLVAQGTPNEIMNKTDSYTGKEIIKEWKSAPIVV
jgi:hypothetical protein